MRPMDVAHTDTFVRDLYGGTLTPGRVTHAMMTSAQWFPSKIVHRGAHVSALASGPRLRDVRMQGATRAYDLVDYLSLNRITGLLVLHRGQVVREDYELGFGPACRHASFSLAKSVCSTLVGCALKDGLISSLDTPLAALLPALRGSAYEEVPLWALLAMRTGVAWDETYTKPQSDRRRFLEAQLQRRPGALLAVMTSLRRRHPVGHSFNYSTGETFLVGAVIEAITGGSLADYLSQRLWQPLGMEQDASWWVESPEGMGMGGSGLAATLRDYGRFAQFVVKGGTIGGAQVVPAGWFDASTWTRSDQAPYGYQWWLPPASDPRHQGALLGMGIFGQRLYVHPARELAIVVLSARSKPSDSHVIPDEDFFAAVIDALAA
jgi:CubicO group peptidase (beta-lactamase class C family)